MIRTIKGWLGVSIVLLLVAMPAQAGDWQEHGFFFVQSKLTSDNKTACEIELSLNVKQQLFALVWVEIEDGNSPLIVNYMSGDPRIALAKRVVVTIDGAEILAFSPNSRLSEPEITTLSGLLPGEDCCPLLGGVATRGGKSDLANGCGGRYFGPRSGERPA